MHHETQKSLAKATIYECVDIKEQEIIFKTFFVQIDEINAYSSFFVDFVYHDHIP